MNRGYTYSRHLQAGCYVCHGRDAEWHGKNAQAVAARHCDATGHKTWVRVEMFLQYNKQQNPARPGRGSDGS